MENYVMLGYQFNLKGFIFRKSMLIIINYLQFWVVANPFVNHFVILLGSVSD